jgi:4'-phosphopantetheinyl transferase
MNSEPLLWESPPGKLALDRREVHVWRGRLDLEAETLGRLWAILSPDEQNRAKRYRFAKDRDAFVAARGMLRGILSRYLDLSPEALRFDYSVHGKPFLPGELDGARLRFNLSHSHGLALCAVASRREVGIDVEYQRPELADESIAERFFSAREITTLRLLPSSLQRAAFFACWTRKEAYMKAVGRGLTIPLDRVEVTLAPGETVALLSTEGGPADAGRWSLRELEPGAGYAAAVVVEGHDWQLRCWNWAVPSAPG